MNYILSFLLLASYLMIVRLSGYDVDMKVYAETLSLDVSRMTLSLYYIKEPVYWFLSNWLFDIFEKPSYVFFIFDTMSVFFITLGFYKLNIPSYFLLAFFLFFPMLFGYQNIYRQYLSLSVFIYAMSMNDESFKSKICYLIISGLIHNVSFLLFPAVLLKRKASDTFYVYLSYIVASVGIFSLLPIFVSTKSFSETGLSLAPFYVGIIFSINIVYLAVNQWRFNKNKAEINRMINVFYFLLLTVLSVLYMGGAQAERVGMSVFLISVIYLFELIRDKFQQKKFVSFVLILIMVFPTFLFSSAFNMLLTKGD